MDASKPRHFRLGSRAPDAALSTALAYVLYFRILATAGATNLLLVTSLPRSPRSCSVPCARRTPRDNRHFIGMVLIGGGLAVIDGASQKLSPPCCGPVVGRSIEFATVRLTFHKASRAGPTPSPTCCSGKVVSVATGCGLRALPLRQSGADRVGPPRSEDVHDHAYAPGLRRRPWRPDHGPLHPPRAAPCRGHAGTLLGRPARGGAQPLS